MRADKPVEDQHRARQHHRRHRQEDDKGRHDHRPNEQWDAVERHSGRPLLEDGADDLDRHRERRQLGEGDHLRPDVGSLAGCELRAG